MLLTALGVGVLQIVGSIGAANNQPDRKGLDVLAVALLLIGPIALAVRDRFPLTAIVASTAAAAVYIANGYPYGPIFFSIVVALYNGVQLRRRATWVLAGLGYLSFLVAEAVDRVPPTAWAGSTSCSSPDGFCSCSPCPRSCGCARSNGPSSSAWPVKQGSGRRASSGYVSLRSCTTCSRTTSR